MDNTNAQKNSLKFSCEKCQYTCCNKFDFNRHLSTRKHAIDNAISQNVAISHRCSNCNNVYKHQSGLCKHRKTCRMQIEAAPDDVQSLKSIVIELIKSNSELQRQSQEYQAEQSRQSFEIQKQILELCKNGTHNTNSDNKSFNINMFLNEHCNNLSDFVKNVEAYSEDLENNAQLDFVNGISKIIFESIKVNYKTA